jgi:NAD(P)-dependent dehydrogenase (short-subunit alcohol dehydrogenase family)
MKQVIVITGASSGFGALTSYALARQGHIVYATMSDIRGHNAVPAEAVHQQAADTGVDLRVVELDVTSEQSVNSAMGTILDREGQLDIVVHNAGHMVFGPSEAFTPGQLAHIYDVNALGTQRLNRAVFPHMRERRSGLLVWVSSSSTRGGTPPYLGPYFAAKAAMDSLAVTYAGELCRWGIETSIIVPGAFTSGTNHFAHAGQPADRQRELAYDEGPYAGIRGQILRGQASLIPPEADVAEVADAIVRIIAMPRGRRPVRVHVDPAQDGAEVVNGVADRVRAEFLRRIGLSDLLTVTIGIPAAD